jgi:hypothetical protein
MKFRRASASTGYRLIKTDKPQEALTCWVAGLLPWGPVSSGFTTGLSIKLPVRQRLIKELSSLISTLNKSEYKRGSKEERCKTINFLASYYCHLTSGQRTLFKVKHF